MGCDYISKRQSWNILSPAEPDEPVVAPPVDEDATTAAPGEPPVDPGPGDPVTEGPPPEVPQASQVDPLATAVVIPLDTCHHSTSMDGEKVYELNRGGIVGMGYNVQFGEGCDGTPDSALITGTGMGYVTFPQDERLDTRGSMTIMVQISASGNGNGPILRWVLEVLLTHCPLGYVCVIIKV